MRDSHVEELLEARAQRSICLQHPREEVIASLLGDGSICVGVLLLHDDCGPYMFLGLSDGE